MRRKNYDRKIPTHNYLKYWRVIRYWAKAKYGLTTPDLDMMFFLYSEDYFNKTKFKDFEQISAHVTSNFENPLLRSGLAFYGANQASDQTLKSDQDGLLVALEVSTLKLTNTDLVVLSACDTGLGNIPRSQGVVGLRRAFQEAGAKSILMSLWQVPDKETRDLMVQFYKKLYQGKSKIKSIHEASLDVMSTIKTKRGTTHPFSGEGLYYWGIPELEIKYA